MTYQAGAPPPCFDQSVEIVQHSLDVIPASAEVFDISDTNAEHGGESFRAPVVPAEGRRTTRARSKVDSPVGSPTKRNQGVSQEPQAGSSKRKLRSSDKVIAEPDNNSSQTPKKRKLKVEPSSELHDALASKTTKVSKSSRVDNSVMEYDS
jgi:hypothetical protein